MKQITPELELPSVEAQINVVSNILDQLSIRGYKVDLLIENIEWDDLPNQFKSAMNGKMFIRELKNGSVTLFPR